ncbi:MAG TPA: hypothetical protein VEL74_14890 [Thermoanaerobaculia bacterium]|nr:hypothetical protein [Thermoanaerobaculia bacterium]
MSNHDDGSTRYPSVPSNVFSGDFLKRFDEEDEPPTALEAELAGVGTVFPVPEGHALYLPGEALLQAAGKVTLERVGTLLARRVPAR